MKGAIYYTDNRPKWFVLDKCREQIKKACPYKIVSVSLHKPVDLGENICITDRERSYPTMLFQIVTALKKLDTKYVFFLEHDVLYHPSHFDFIPPTDHIYYYNVNNYRWHVREQYAITYDGLHSLSALCCNRETALKHFQARLDYVEAEGWDKERSREPRWGRVMGYEPGTKKKRRGGFSDEDFEIWRSEMPNVDIRHRHTFSSPKTRLDEFKHPPVNWKQVDIKDIPYWNLEKLHKDWIHLYLPHLINW
jgi:hypothetical protein